MVVAASRLGKVKSNGGPEWELIVVSVPVEKAGCSAYGPIRVRGLGPNNWSERLGEDHRCAFPAPLVPAHDSHEGSEPQARDER